MKKIIRYISIIGIFLFLLQPMIGNAGALEEYEEAHTLYLAAVACTAAYSDRVGDIARDALEQNGWEIQSYVGKSRQADARFFVAKKIPPGSTVPIYLFSVVGTENMKDVKTDLRVDKVYFAGKNPEEFLANAQLKNMPNTVPKVHKGFNQYVQAGLATEVMEEESNSKRPLLDMLLENKDRKVYLVGHSLGGAAVTLGGARLLDMGVKPEQIEVITFGAPAVGNKAFRDKFEPVLHLTRIVATGDPITGALQQLVGGYEQFGHEIRWQTPGSENAGPHDITLYLDLAIKNYYDKRQKAVLAGELSVPDQARGVTATPRVYVAPIKNNLPADLQNEFIYMKEALQDEYRSAFPGYVLDMGEDDKAVFQKAIDAQCEWVVMPKVEAHKAKNEDNVYYITLEQSVYRADSGAIFNTASYGSNTRTLTSVEALIHDAKNMSSNKHEWLASANKKN